MACVHLLVSLGGRGWGLYIVSLESVGTQWGKEEEEEEEEEEAMAAGGQLSAGGANERLVSLGTQGQAIIVICAKHLAVEQIPGKVKAPPSPPTVWGPLRLRLSFYFPSLPLCQSVRPSACLTFLANFSFL